MLALVVLAVAAAASVLAAGHALINKRDPRSSLGWIAVCLLAPGLGAVLYWMFGINRIRTRARKYQRRRPGLGAKGSSDAGSPGEVLSELVPVEYRPLVHTAAAVTRRPLLPGNRVHALYGGEQAYPEMLAAIDGARSSVCLASYLFDGDGTGRAFASALRRAAAGGAEVRVLLDGFGQLMSRPSCRGVLADAGIRYAEFLPLDRLGSRIHVNLRNHRKLLVVDGRLGFTGGMNIGDRHVAERAGPRVSRDVHFRVTGPVVPQMAEAFAEDWAFATGEPFEPAAPQEISDPSPALCRGVSDGPNEDFEKLLWIILGACHAARSRLRVMTPYFVPTRSLIAGLCAAALRGVEVDVMVPGKTDHPLVNWASRAMLGELLEHGVRVYLQPAPFDHTKLLLVDDVYSLVGSANLDPRSLRLNFEFNLEVYDQTLTRELAQHFDREVARAEEVSREDLERRPLAVQLRDAFAKLLSPYL